MTIHQFGHCHFYLKSLLTILIFLNYGKNRIFTSPQKNDKWNFENYRPISLPPILSRVFEKIIFNKLYAFLPNEQLLNRNQFGFRPSDSCINQLLSIRHEIFQSFDTTPPLEVWSVFLDISKAFDNVWHEGLLFKLNSIGIWGKFYK